MNFLKSSVLFAALLIPVADADAHGYRGWRGGGYHGGWGRHYGGWGRGGFYGGIVIGPGFGYGGGWGWPYYPPYYAYPPAVVTVPVPTEPPTYIEQGTPQQPAQQDPSNYWHYCADPPGYYPTVEECPGGWQLVPPQPSSPQ